MVEWKKLGEIGKCMAGATPSTKESSYWDNGTIPWMSSGEVHQEKGNFYEYDLLKRIIAEIIFYQR